MTSLKRKNSFEIYSPVGILSGHNILHSSWFTKFPLCFLDLRCINIRILIELFIKYYSKYTSMRKEYFDSVSTLEFQKHLVRASVSWQLCIDSFTISMDILLSISIFFSFGHNLKQSQGCKTRTQVIQAFFSTFVLRFASWNIDIKCPNLPPISF